MFSQGANVRASGIPPLPSRFRCSICGEYKNQAHFSNRELRSLSSSNAARAAAMARMRCRMCTGGGRQEMECERCGQVKAIDQFSKNSRKNGGNQWCMECTIWKESAAPRPADQDSQDWQTDDLIDDMARSTISTATTSRPGTVLGEGPQSFASTPSFNQSRAYRAPVVLSQYTPPHLMLPKKVTASAQDDKSTSSASNTYNTSQSVATSTSEGGWKELDTKRRVQAFNAWDSNGQMQRRVMSVAGSSTSGVPTSSASIVSTLQSRSMNPTGSWAGPNGSRTQTAGSEAAAMPSRPQKTQYDSDSESTDEA